MLGYHSDGIGRHGNTYIGCRDVFDDMVGLEVISTCWVD